MDTKQQQNYAVIYKVKKENIKLLYRTYRCDNCGLVIDRDLNSVINILKIGIKEVEKSTIKNY
ncbi:MAG: zinc ribbon domain-containing protein [bacterium]